MEEKEEDLEDIENLLKKQDAKLDKYRDKLERAMKELEDVAIKNEDQEATDK